MYLYVEFRINNFTIVNLMLSFVFIFADVVFLEVLDCTFCPGIYMQKEHVRRGWRENTALISCSIAPGVVF
jgi:hypothetical protein